MTKTGTTLTLDDVHSVAISRGPCSYPDPADDTFVQRTVGATTPDVHVEPGDKGDTVTVVGGGSVHWLIGVGDGADVVNLSAVGQGGAHVVGGNGDDRVISSTFGEQIEGNAGNDLVSFSGHAAAVVVNLATGTGGSVGENDAVVGIERVVGGSGNDTLTGDGNANTLDGGPANDALWGAGGNDTLVGGTGTDEFHGGAGTDLASYQAHPSAVTASLNGLADDGAPGESDLIAADVENLGGGGYSDTLSGNSAPNALYGDILTNFGLPVTGGDDVIATNGSGDGVYGGGGDDTVYGGSGHDVVHGGYGDDVMYGGSHEDGLYGEARADWLYGQGGFDILDGGTEIDLCDAGAEGASKTACELSFAVT